VNQLGKNEDIVYWLGDKLYLNITNRCSNRCYFCFRHYWNGIAGFNLRLSAEPSIDQVIRDLEKHMSKKAWREIVFCGFGEPTYRLDCLLEVTKWIKKYSLVRVRLDTNGHAHLINPGKDVVRELKEAGVNAISVSINGHDKETYNRVCKPIFADAYESAIEFVKSAREASFDVEITSVRIPEVNLLKLRDLASKLNVRFRVREYIPCFY